MNKLLKGYLTKITEEPNLKQLLRSTTKARSTYLQESLGVITTENQEQLDLDMTQYFNH
jgi:hypothetical protein